MQKRKATSLKLSDFERAVVKGVAGHAGYPQGEMVAKAVLLVDRLESQAMTEFHINPYLLGAREKVYRAVLECEPGPIDPKSELGRKLQAIAKEQAEDT